MMRYARLVLVVVGMLFLLWACSGSGVSTTGDQAVGTPCTRTADCSQGLVCYRTEKPDGEAGPRNYLPDGYCTKNCSIDDDCEGNVCLQGYCMKSCSDDSQCDRSGYKCWDGKACAANFDIGAGCGGTCENGMTCASSTDDPGFGSGYCTFSCENARECPMWGGANCAAPSGGEDKFCLMACKNDTECRTEDGFGCRMVHIDADLNGDGQDINFCAGADNIGAACGSDGDCSDGLDCRDPGDTLFDDKICSKGCDADNQCPENSVCTADADGFCARKCYRDDHCGISCPDDNKDLCKYACRYVRTDSDTNDDEMFCSGVNNLGAACGGNEDCSTGLFCEGDDDAFPGGFCTVACSDDDECTPYGAAYCSGGKCQRTCQDSEGRGWDFICARKFYTCHKPDSDKGYVCSGFENYGAACKDNSDCSAGLTCREGNAFPNGYCTNECQSDAECAGGGFAHCENGYCARSCEESADCGRYGYVCLDGGNGKYCSIPPNVGAECEDYEDLWKTDCSEGLYCKTDEAWPDGYCTFDCPGGKDEDCPQGSSSACIDRMCMRTCGSDDDCWRARYSCRGKTKKVDDVNVEFLVCLGIPNVGGACSKDEDCSQGESYQLACSEETSTWAGQFCTMACGNDSDCPDQSACAGSSSGTCVRSCSLDAECGRKHYICLSNGECKANPNVGQTCEVGGDCYSGMSCFEFAAGVKACSKECEDHNDCYPESSGMCVETPPPPPKWQGTDGGTDAGDDAAQADAGPTDGGDGGVADAADTDGAAADAGDDGGTVDAGQPDAGALPAKHCVRSCERDSDCGRPGEFVCDTTTGACKIKE